MPISLNFRDYTSSFEAAPAGVYRAVVEGVELRKNKADTADYLNITYKLLNESVEGKLVWDMCSFSENALFQVVRLLKNYEIPYKETGLQFEMSDENGIREYSGIRLSTEDNERGNKDFLGFVTDDGVLHPLTGAVVEVVLDTTEYNGQTKNVVSDVQLVTPAKGQAGLPQNANSGRSGGTPSFV